MPRLYGTIRTAFWDDQKVQDVSQDAMSVFIYLLSSRHTNAIGLFRLPIEYAQGDLKAWVDPSERVSKGFDELISKGFITYCDETKFVLVHNFLKYNDVQNQNVAKFCLKQLSEAAELPPNVPMVQWVIQFALTKKLRHFEALRNDLESLSKALLKTSDTLSELPLNRGVRDPFERLSKALPNDIEIPRTLNQVRSSAGYGADRPLQVDTGEADDVG